MAESEVKMQPTRNGLETLKKHLAEIGDDLQNVKVFTQETKIHFETQAASFANIEALLDTGFAVFDLSDDRFTELKRNLAVVKDDFAKMDDCWARHEYEWGEMDRVFETWKDLVKEKESALTVTEMSIDCLSQEMEDFHAKWWNTEMHHGDHIQHF